MDGSYRATKTGQGLENRRHHYIKDCVPRYKGGNASSEDDERARDGSASKSRRLPEIDHMVALINL